MLYLTSVFIILDIHLYYFTHKYTQLLNPLNDTVVVHTITVSTCAGFCKRKGAYARVTFFCIVVLKVKSLSINYF